MNSKDVEPNYWKVFLTFANNSLIRDMTFRTNFLLQCVSSVGWTLMNVGFYLILFQYTDTIGAQSGWDRDKFFLFLATTWFINSVVQTFFMPNAEEFSEPYKHHPEIKAVVESEVTNQIKVTIPEEDDFITFGVIPAEKHVRGHLGDVKKNPQGFDMWGFHLKEDDSTKWRSVYDLYCAVFKK